MPSNSAFSASVNAPDAQIPFRFLRLPELIRICGVGRSTILAHIDRGTFPKPIRLPGTRALLWSSLAISRWLESQSENTETAAK